MEKPDIAPGDYLVYRGTGIGRVKWRKEIEGLDGEVVPAISLETLRFTGRPAGDDMVIDLGVSYALPLTPENLRRLRKPMGRDDFFVLLGHMASEEPRTISKKELLSHSFSLDFFEPEEGARQAVVLHDYVIHRSLEGIPCCMEYADLYRHGISSVAFEVSTTAGLDDALARRAVEAALFVGHQGRECVACLRHDGELAATLEPYTETARRWIRSVLRGRRLRPMPAELEAAPFFLDPLSIPVE